MGNLGFLQPTYRRNVTPFITIVGGSKFAPERKNIALQPPWLAGAILVSGRVYMHSIGESPKSWYNWFWRTIWLIPTVYHMFTKNLGWYLVSPISGHLGYHMLVRFGQYIQPLFGNGWNTIQNFPDQQNPIPIGIKFKVKWKTIYRWMKCSLCYSWRMVFPSKKVCP